LSPKDHLFPTLPNRHFQFRPSIVSVDTAPLSGEGSYHTAALASGLLLSTEPLSTRTPCSQSLASAIMVDSRLGLSGRSGGSLARSSLHLAQVTLYRSIVLCCHCEGLPSKLVPQLIFDRFMLVQLPYEDIILGRSGQRHDSIVEKRSLRCSTDQRDTPNIDIVDRPPQVHGIALHNLPKGIQVHHDKIHRFDPVLAKIFFLYWVFPVT